MAITAPTSTSEFIDLISKSGILPADTIERHRHELPEQAAKCAAWFVRKGLLTTFQSKLILGGRYRGFRFGPYIIKDQIGKGGMGTVFLAEHEALRRKVAIKTLSSTESVTQVTIERFMREARAAAALDHPNIVRLFDVAKQANMHYLVMEYVNGKTLDQILTDRGTIPFKQAVELMFQAANGLQHAHEKGFVHRDIKPANLMLNSEHQLKILDMGLARSHEASDKLTEILDHGAIVGTADYISPEQAVNAPNLDIRADIYSLGATFYHVLLGRPPYEGSTSQKLMQHQFTDVIPLDKHNATIPVGVANVISKCLKKIPDQRYQTPQELMHDLLPFMAKDSPVIMALSRTNLGKSIAVQETVVDMKLSGTRIRSKNPVEVSDQAAKNSKLLLIGGIAAGVVACLAIVGLIATGTFSSSEKPKNTEVAQVTPTPLPAVANTGVTKTPEQNLTKKSAATVTNRKVHYEMKLDSAAPYVERGSLTASNANNPKERLWTPTDIRGVGKLPVGWTGKTWRDNDIAEFGVVPVDDRMALSIMRVGNSGSAAYYLYVPKLKNQEAKMKLQYRSAAKSGNLHIRAFPPNTISDTNKYSAAKLKCTGVDEWVDAEFTIPAMASQDVVFEFYLFMHTNDIPLFIRDVVVSTEE